MSWDQNPDHLTPKSRLLYTRPALSTTEKLLAGRKQGRFQGWGAPSFLLLGESNQALSPQ